MYQEMKFVSISGRHYKKKEIVVFSESPLTKSRHSLRNRLSYSELFVFVSVTSLGSLCVSRQQDILESHEWISMKVGGQALGQGGIDYI